jgi:hypothetical protein
MNVSATRHGSSEFLSRTPASLHRIAQVAFCLLLLGVNASVMADTQTLSLAGTVTGADWSNLANAASIDGACAFPNDLNPEPVRLTNWGFTIPAGATINGIAVRVQGASSAGGNDIQLIQGGTTQGTTFSAGISGGACPGTEATVGGAAELWALAWTDANINAADFGVEYRAEFQGRQFDGVEVTVDYTPAGVDSDLAISAIDNNSGAPVVAGSGAGNISYSFTVTNDGPADVGGIESELVASLTLGAGITCSIPTVSEGSAVVSGIGISVTWSGVDLAFQEAATMDLSCTADATATHNAVFAAELSVTSLSGTDPNPANDSASLQSTIIREAVFDVSKVWDGSGGGEVNVTLTCNDAVVSSGFTSGQMASFTLTGFADNTVCTIEEDIPAGFSPTYSPGCAVNPVVSGSIYDCVITNAVSNATFAVTKAYSDGNDDEVEVMLSCNNGLPLEQTFTISEGNPVFFVITNFTDGEADCEVTETGTADGYTPSYDNGSVVSDVSCAYENIGSAEYTCTISNAADPATFTVTKEWVIEGAVGEEVQEEASVSIFCNNAIDGGFWNGSEYQYNTFLSGDGDFVEVSVDTTTQSAQCRAEENIFQSGVETADDCGTRTIPAGGSSSCTITNTVFFEGIPTLSQWGLAILALLMLGMGLVGLRRFA